MTAISALAAEPSRGAPDEDASAAAAGAVDRLLDGLRVRLELEIGAAIRDAAGAQAQLARLRTDRPARAVHGLDLAGDRCRSAAHHAAQATRAATEIRRLERTTGG